MDNQTLVAVIRNNRNNVELIARNRQEIIESLDTLRLDTGDVVTLAMCFMDNHDLATIPENNMPMFYAVQNEGYQPLLEA
jgi:DeoR/GlpR family transcriptional regulator of sugar metabolism